ncbi:MAG TPA: adenosylhomocysteinase, partial [Candidatus Aerophobetes bacterium]|nr:adenosylhomocysteinase [Candidatus Aerophobetes bacterium]
MDYIVKDIKLSLQGKTKIEWAFSNMKVVGKIRERFSQEKPLKGIKIAACLHVTPETAV